jgi:hypothetical protein
VLVRSVAVCTPHLTRRRCTPLTPPPHPHPLPVTTHQVLIFDSWFDEYRGVICIVNVRNGLLKPGVTVTAASTGLKYIVQEASAVPLHWGLGSGVAPVIAYACAWSAPPPLVAKEAIPTLPSHVWRMGTSPRHSRAHLGVPRLHSSSPPPPCVELGGTGYPSQVPRAPAVRGPSGLRCDGHEVALGGPCWGHPAGPRTPRRSPAWLPAQQAHGGWPRGPLTAWLAVLARVATALVLQFEARPRFLPCLHLGSAAERQAVCVLASPAAASCWCRCMPACTPLTLGSSRNWRWRWVQRIRASEQPVVHLHSLACLLPHLRIRPSICALTHERFRPPSPMSRCPSCCSQTRVCLRPGSPVCPWAWACGVASWASCTWTCFSSACKWSLTRPSSIPRPTFLTPWYVAWRCPVVEGVECALACAGGGIDAWEAGKGDGVACPPSLLTPSPSLPSPPHHPRGAGHA